MVDDPQISFGNQILTVKLNEPYQGKIQAKLSFYPQFHYGDRLAFEGKIDLPQAGSYANYLAKENISGLANFPKAELEKSGLGSPIRAALFKFKNSISDSYSKILAPEQAALLGGLILGERGGFSKEFKKAMSLSGTAHLTALSGQNITIISTAVATAVGFFVAISNFHRGHFNYFKFCGYDWLWLVSRPGGHYGIRRFIGQLDGSDLRPRNSIALAAFLITLSNPKVLIFDLGFQLSFWRFWALFIFGRRLSDC